jgi:hypothetical protein
MDSDAEDSSVDTDAIAEAIGLCHSEGLEAELAAADAARSSRL